MKRKKELTENDWGVIIISGTDGYVIQDNDGNWHPITEGEGASAELNLLWFIIDYFAMRPSRYDKERVFASMEAGDKYQLQKGEKFTKEYFDIVKDK